jgi:twinkle protein
VARELAYYLIDMGQKVGYIALEESVKKTSEYIMGLRMNVPPHLWLDREVTTDQKREAFEATVGSGKMVLYDHWGSIDPANLLNRVRYMARAMECKYVFLDHLSIVVSAMESGDERRTIDATMTKLRSLVEETNIHLVLVSHLRRPEGRSHEEGGSTSLSQLRGSHAIAQLSDAVIGCERNQQEESAQNLMSLRVLKNRYAGETGLSSVLEYCSDTGRLSEWIAPDIVAIPE